MKLKKSIGLFAACVMLGSCSAEAVQANTVPAAVYISTEQEAEPAESSKVSITEEITAEADVIGFSSVTTAAVTTATTDATTTAATTTSVKTTTSPATTTTSEKTTATSAAATAATTAVKPVVYKNTIEILGPNMVYTGESFDFTYKISHRNAKRASVLWQCQGEAGRISADGKFEAIKKGTVTIRLSDISNGLIDSLVVHVVDTPEDVNFVPEVNGIPVVNKTYPVPANYNPGLSNKTYNAFLELKQAALNDGIEINFMSGYRSYEEQKKVYEEWCEVYPNGQADRVSARPGHSEHQLGLAIDVNSIEFTFADTPEGLWLAENCYKFGFIIRYKKGAEHITGYMYEPWHIRYLGRELAEEVHFSGLTLEEYLGIDSGYRVKEYDLGSEDDRE